MLVKQYASFSFLSEGASGGSIDTAETFSGIDEEGTVNI